MARSNHSSPTFNFGCGFLFGAAISGSSFFFFDFTGTGALVLGVITGLAAAVVGDRFWTDEKWKWFTWF